MNRTGRTLALLAALFLTSMAGAALAHKPSDSYLRLDVEEATINGQWDIALRDLDFATGLDSNQDNTITWGEVKTRHGEIAAYALSRLTLSSAEAECEPVAREHLIDNHSDGAYAVLRFTATCPSAPASLDVGYRLFFDIDPQHRGLVAVTAAGSTRTFVAGPDATSTLVDFRAESRFSLFLTFVAHGAHHIWIGYDHILFLLTLLLGTVLTRRGGAWVPVDKFGSALASAVKVVTAFTASHSLTLALAAFGVLQIPSVLTESVIAATITLAAINNIFPVVTKKLWLVALLFGLIHGVGFANVLADLALPRQDLLTALLAFNIGVELGQLAIVVGVLPLLMLAGRRAAYGRVMPIMSLAIAAIGVAWFMQRAFGFEILPIG
jgi:hypothetical protein